MIGCRKESFPKEGLPNGPTAIRPSDKKAKLEVMAVQQRACF